MKITKNVSHLDWVHMSGSREVDRGGVPDLSVSGDEFDLVENFSTSRELSPSVSVASPLLSCAAAILGDGSKFAHEV